MVQNPIYPVDWDRYAYTRNNPITYIDPSGYDTECGLFGNDCGEYGDELVEIYESESGGSEYITFEEFVSGYEAYNYYESHPQEAVMAMLADATSSEYTSWGYAALYGDYWLHYWTAPYTDLELMAQLEEARVQGDTQAWYQIASIFALGVWFEGDKGYGGGGGVGPLKGIRAFEAAESLGYTKRIPAQRSPFNSHGQPVFYNPKTKTFITPDVDAHSGGVWKMFDRKGTRLGTYDAELRLLGN